MLIKKDQEFTVRHRRKGTFRAKAVRDFDTEKEEFYPVVTCEYVGGCVNDWIPGEQIPCRKCLCELVFD